MKKKSRQWADRERIARQKATTERANSQARRLALVATLAAILRDLAEEACSEEEIAKRLRKAAEMFV